MPRQSLEGFVLKTVPRIGRPTKAVKENRGGAPRSGAKKGLLAGVWGPWS